VTILARRGFTLVEAVLSTAVVGVMLVAATHAAGIVATSRTLAAERARGQQLALDLLNEIMDRPYRDPDSALAILGTDVGDSLAPGRLKFDDIDDYQGYIDAPPTSQEGAAIPGLAHWSRSVRVVYLEPGLSRVLAVQGDASDTGAKLIHVSVFFRGKPVTRVQAIRTRAFDEVRP
jgi:prepilin-type N-terminal cleavage/methylation domain-containing protein